jgi:hypothetical protein
MKKLTILLSATILVVTTVHCSKRENPVDPVYPQGLIWNQTFSSQSILGDIMQDPPARGVLVYTPPSYVLDDTSVTFPVLYLLHGFNGHDNYYTSLFGLAAAMDEMIYTGEIDPMIVVTPDATNALGGSFYTNSYAVYDSSQSYAGLMQDFITEEVIPLIDSTFHTVADRDHRGIGGHSMGGYGAVKLAMLRNDLFSSASSMSAPLAFWGGYPADTTFLGLVDLFPFVFAENNFTPGDSAAYYAIAPAPGKRLTNMMFAMGSAFSPHHPDDPDTTYAHMFTTQSTGFVGFIDLPFGADGQLAMPVWNLWMAHDVIALYSAGYGDVFANTDLYVDSGAEDDLGLYGHAQVFQSVAGDNIDQFEIYSGFDDFYPPDHTTYVGERLKEVLIFHSNSFAQ